MKKSVKQKKVLELLLDVSKKVSSSLELDRVSDMILSQARATLGTDYSALFLLDKNSKRLMLIGAKGFKGNQIGNLKVLGGWEAINTEIVKKANAIMVNDIQKSREFKKKKIPFSREKLPIGAFLAVPLKTDSRIIGVLMVSNNKSRRKYFTAEDKKLLYALGNNVSIALLNAKLHNDLKELYLNTIKSLVTAVDAKDHYTHAHSENVAKYAVAIAEEMGLSRESAENLRLAGLLHDIGKIGVEDNILSKASSLSRKEKELMRQHPLIGSNIVRSVVRSKGILKGIAEHHERFDGKGYPKSIKGNKISLEGRIVALADAFDTLATKRSYKKAFTVKEAALEISKSAGNHFDPRIVRAFLLSFSNHPEKWGL